MHTEAINHDPAITLFQTGSQNAGRPSIGAWLSYGLGSMNDDLPLFCVLLSKDKVGQPLYARLWGSGFLPARHQGIQFRAGNCLLARRLAERDVRFIQLYHQGWDQHGNLPKAIRTLCWTCSVSITCGSRSSTRAAISA